MKLADRLPDGPDDDARAVSEKIIAPRLEFDQKQPLKPTDVVQILAESEHVGDRTLDAIAEGLECLKSIANPEVETIPSGLNACPVASKNGASDSLEKDFTTKGAQGSLRCPFAKPNNRPSMNGDIDGVEDAFKAQNGDACGHEHVDPIRAELNDRRSNQTPSAKSSTARCPVSRCPIRYLNEHSPEEVAEYVERHKHEIPRSHAVCVQRYQRSSDSMRQLDAKYGGLINMIRGLSVKHQAFLPNNGQEPGSNSGASAERVEKWAADVDSRSPMHAAIKEEDEEDGGEERQGHFERPLREIRVGESPSRPWGIPVPIQPDPVISAPHSPTAPAPVSGDEGLYAARNNSNEGVPSAGSAAPGRCPFGHGAGQPDNVVVETETIRRGETKQQAADGDAGNQANDTADTKRGKSGNVVFNGPVFFGYSAEQTASFIQNLGSLRNNL